MIDKGSWGIIAAMKIEAEHIAAAMEDARTETVGGIEFTVGKLRGKQEAGEGSEFAEADIILAVCGVGKVNAAMCAQTMIVTYHPDKIVNTGVAGALSTELGVGDVVLASDLVEHDLDTTALGDPPGLIPGLDAVKMRCSEQLSMSELKKAAEEALAGTGAKILSGVIATGDQFVADGEKKKQIVERFGAVACEMEGGAVAQVCSLNRVPFAVIRTMSDSADGRAVDDYPAFARKAAGISAEIVIRAATLIP